MQYRLRTLLILMAVVPPVLAWMWFTAHRNYGLEILAASLCLLFVMALPLVIFGAFVERRRYLLDFDRRHRHRSGLFNDNWPQTLGTRPMFRFRLSTLLILMAAAPLWIYLITILSTANKFQRLDGTVLIVAPILLSGITAAIYRLTRTMPDGLAVAALLSPIIPLAWILAVRISNTF